MKTRKPERQRLAIRLDVGITHDLNAQLVAECRRLGEDKAAVVRIALRHYFERRQAGSACATALGGQPLTGDTHGTP